MMDKKERVRAALRGEVVDRTPVAFWGHDFFREWSPQDLAAYTVERYRRDDDDFIKLNPRATYYYEAWGNTYDRPDTPRQPRMLGHALHSAADLAALPEIDPGAGPFGEQTEALRLVLAEVGADVDVVQTVFSPLAVAGRLAGPDLGALRRWAREDAAAVHTGLATITRVLARYSRQAIEAGASGIFFATTEWATRENADEDFYREFGRPYDLQVLQAVRGAPFNIAHICRAHNLIDLTWDYPVAAFNWSTAEEGNVSLSAALERTDRALIGGMNQQAMPSATADELAAHARAALRETGGRRHLIAGGCAISPLTPVESIHAVIAAVRGA
jgi:uroporphyrinogen decarboxylase